MGYERLLTDFGHPLHGSRLAMSIVLAPRERVDLNEAKDKWVSFQNGPPTLHGLFQLYGNKICTLAHERFDPMPLLIAQLQSDLVDAHQCAMAELCGPD